MLSVTFSPLIPDLALYALGAVVALLAVLAILSRGAIAVIRAVALALVLLALANPSLIQEERDKVNDIVAVVIDRSTSQTLGDRRTMTDNVRAELERRFANVANVETRYIEAEDGDGDDGTRLFTALTNGLADVPPNRLAGVLLVTDGVVHDIPASVESLGFRVPLHALVTGRENERDRQIKLLEAPRFGIVGKDQTIRAEIQERGGTGSALLTVRRDGQLFISYYDLTNHDLKLAYHNGLRWDLYTVDSPGDVGRYSSVAVDPSGKPHISYYDSTNGDLKLASAEIITIDGTFLYLPLLSN